MDNSLMSLVGGFIAVAIMLGIGTLILGGATTDCTTVADFNTTLGAGNQAADTWAGQCEANNTQARAGYGLLIITLIVLAAVVVLTVVRMLG